MRRTINLRRLIREEVSRVLGSGRRSRRLHEAYFNKGYAELYYGEEASRNKWSDYTSLIKNQPMFKHLPKAEVMKMMAPGGPLHQPTMAKKRDFALNKIQDKLVQAFQDNGVMVDAGEGNDLTIVLEA